uniref:Uncharacterized protein n=1 Tax=Candidatus Kentrum sp. LFY TaxID=2126342 RepID=A0A450X203_9GAMM|nr:MAG: hypothetical protein BECKLFY1418C_GA0070996_11382 [Candidatus Kentron sp. LFY]
MPDLNLVNLGTWIVIVVGWIVVNQQNNARETRKELRARIDLVQTWTFELVDLATGYHTGESGIADKYSNRYQERVIKSRLDRVTRTISSLRKSTLGKSPYNSPHEAYHFRQAVTLHNFDTSEYKAQPPDSELLDDIAMTAQSLMDSLEEAYSKRYHPAWLRRLRLRWRRLS